MPFGSLWLPVVVSAVAVWLLSAVLHMVLRYHRADYRRLADEESVAAALGKQALPPGIYTLPHCTPEQMKDPAVRERYARGPVGMITVMPNGMPAMGKYLGLWLLFCLLVSFTAAYVARHALGVDAAGLLILRVTGTIAFAGYAYASFQDVIWKAVPWPVALRHVVDSLLYAVATGLIFRWLWPAG